MLRVVSMSMIRNGVYLNWCSITGWHSINALASHRCDPGSIPSKVITNTLKGPYIHSFGIVRNTFRIRNAIKYLNADSFIKVHKGFMFQTSETL